MNAHERYVIGEHVEDYDDGLITRRELLRRVTIISGSATAALAALVTLGCDLERPAASSATPGASVSARSSPSPAVGYATPPPSPTTDGITVRPDDPRIRAQRVDVKAADGASLIGYLARPSADGPRAGVLVIHENRGLTEHITDVVRRVATAGFAGLSIDLVSRAGGADRLTDGAAYQAELTKLTTDGMVRDLAAALDYLTAQAFVDGSRFGAVGFCFGGGMAWSLLESGAALNAAAPYYGPAPQKLDGLARTKAAVYAVYAEQDTRITSSRTGIEEQLRSGAPYELVVYPGVNHAFHNDTGARYDAAQAQKAWVATIELFRKYLGA